jgi:uncharacterized protein (TIGR02145 family)
MRVFCITGFLCLLPFLGFSQGEWNQWRFGNHAGLSFNILPPVSISGSAMVTYNSTASVSDSLGNLLFYSDGASVWNKNNQLMPNGSGLFGTMYNSQPVYAIQNLSNPNNYYVFYMGPYGFQPMLPQGLYYSVVDMQLNGGLGDIVTGMKNIPVPGGGNVANLMTGTRKHNNKEVWLVVRNMQPSNYLAYSITAAGINPIPVVSPSFITPTSLPMQFLSGEMKISQDGNRLVSNYVNDTIAEICSFNSTTGLITPYFTIRPQYQGDSSHYFGVEFSRNSNVLYFTVAYDGAVVPNIPSSLLFQYNAVLNDSAQFIQSATIIDSFFNSGGYQKLQLAPDGKIYSPLWAKDSLGIIHNPETLGLGCNFQRNAIGLNGNNVYYGLPQFLQKYKAFLHYSGNGCQSDSLHFSGDIWPPPDTIRWNFGDLASGAGNVSYLSTPAHLFSAPGTYTIELYVRHNDNRTDTTWQTITIYPNPAPSLGPDRTICSGNSVTFDAGFCSGCIYEWKNVGSGLIVGTNQTFATGTSGIYCVNVTNGNGCTGKDTVQLITTPVPVVTNNPPLLKSICTGESTNIPLFGNEPGIMFHWTAILTSGDVTGFTADSGQVINQILINNGATAGIVTYHITPKIGDCAGTPVDYTVTVNVGDPVDVTISASGNAVCVGTPVTFTATPVNPGNTPVYQWKVNGVNAGSNAPTYAYTPANGDIVTCILTSSNTVCTSNNPATSNAITMVVNPIQPVSVTVSPSANPVCSGTTVNFTALPVNGGSNPSWLWKVNGLVVGSNTPAYSYVPVNGDAVTCTLTSNVQCPSGNPAISGTITMIVNPNLPVGVLIVASSNPFCAGSSVTFTALPVNGGTTPGYQWKVNGINAGSNSPVLTYSPANGDMVTCSLVSSETCTSGNPAQSNPVTMVVNANLPAGITIAASANPFCPGSAVTFTATPVNGGSTPVYQWKVNGTNAGTNASTFTYNPQNNDSVRCILTSNLNCVTGNPVSSAKIIMSGTLAPVVTFTSCFDTITTIGAKPYKLKGGIPLGGTYSGPGVNGMTGIFTPSVAGTGLKTISYTYTNVASCSAGKSKTILVQPSPAFTCGNSFSDIRDGKSYPTVQIGTQCWMAANLNRGTQITSAQVQFDNCVDEKYCFGNDAAKCSKYGGLYQWDEMMRYDDVPEGQGLCPPGWHIPTDNDWTVLCNFYNGYGFAGKPLQDTIISGFRALPGGIFYLNSRWSFADFAVLFWTSSSWGSYKALSHGMNTINFSVSLYPSSRANAFPVRCLRD